MMINRVENQKVIVILMSCIGLLAKKWPIGGIPRETIYKKNKSKFISLMKFGGKVYMPI